MTTVLRYLLLVGLAATSASAATFAVTKTADTADGTCDADCSLREAVLAANVLAGPDEVILPAGTYQLTSDQLLVDDDGEANTTDDALTLRGAGATSTVIEQTTPGGVMRIDGDVSSALIEDVTIRGGSGTDGAGIITFAPTTLRRVVITDCHADDDGGALMNFDTLLVEDSMFSGNSATDDAGALMVFAPATVKNSSFVGNTAQDDAGAIMPFEPTVLDGVTLSGNSAGRSGGAITNFTTLTIVNSTFSDNEAGTAAFGGGRGGAIITFDPLRLTGSTITANRAELEGGGIYTSFAPANSDVDANRIVPLAVPVDTPVAVEIEGSIVAPNTPDDCARSESALPVQSLGRNLDSDGTCVGAPPAGGDLTTADPGLGLLADNGGPTMTHAPLPGSPALDAWPGCGLPADQRGVPRPQGPECDIGAVETAVETTTTTVTTTSATSPPTTTTTLAAVCVRTLDFPSLLCRIDELLAGTNAATDLGKQARGMGKAAGKARSAAARGRAQCAEGARKSKAKASRALRSVGRKLLAYRRQLTSLRARRQLPAEVRERFLALVGPLLDDTRAFRRSVVCPRR